MWRQRWRAAMVVALVVVAGCEFASGGAVRRRADAGGFEAVDVDAGDVDAQSEARDGAPPAPVDAGELAPDAAVVRADAAVVDAAQPADAVPADASQPDASPPDASAPDASLPDAGGTECPRCPLLHGCCPDGTCRLLELGCGDG